SARESRDRGANDREALVKHAALVVTAMAIALTSYAPAAHAAAPVPTPHACSPCTYRVAPGGAGAQNLSYVLAHLVQADDVVILDDGVYRVANLSVSAPHVTIVGAHVPSVGHQPAAWLDGSI